MSLVFVNHGKPKVILFCTEAAKQELSQLFLFISALRTYDARELRGKVGNFLLSIRCNREIRELVFELLQVGTSNSY